MKKLTCRELGGPDGCDAPITGETKEELGAHARNHLMEMVLRGDEGHKKAAADLMKASRPEQEKMIADFEKLYEATPEV